MEERTHGRPRLGSLAMTYRYEFLFDVRSLYLFNKAITVHRWPKYASRMYVAQNKREHTERYLLHKFTYNYLKNRFGHFVRHFIAVGRFVHRLYLSLDSSFLFVLAMSSADAHAIQHIFSRMHISNQLCFGECKEAASLSSVAQKKNQTLGRIACARRGITSNHLPLFMRYDRWYVVWFGQNRTNF